MNTLEIHNFSTFLGVVFSAVFRCEININEFYNDKACHLSAFLIFIFYCDHNSLFEVIYQFIIAWRMPDSNQIYNNIYISSV